MRRNETMRIARRLHSPPFSRRGGCAINKKIPFLSGADEVVSRFQQKFKVRYADIHKEATRPFTNHPVCAAKERYLLLRLSHPSLKTEGNSSLQHLSSTSKSLGSGSTPEAA